MAGTLSVVMHVVLDGFVANVAEQKLAVDTVHFVLPAPFGVDRLACRTLDAPFDVDVGVPIVAHVLLNHLLRD